MGSNRVRPSIDFLVFVKGILVFLGSSLLSPFQIYFSQMDVLGLYMVGGSIGLLLTFLSLIYVRVRKEEIGISMSFSYSLILFSIGSCILIVIGRYKDNLSIVTSDRYMMWSFLFWIGLAIVVFNCLLLVESEKIRNYTVVSFLSGVFLYITYNNSHAIVRRMVSYNISMRSMIDLVVSPDKVGNEIMTWHANSKREHFRLKVLDVNSHLKNNGKWPYSQGVYNKVGESLDMTNLILGEVLYVDASYKNDNYENFYIEMYLDFAKSNSRKRPSSVYVVQENVVVGLVLPYSDFQKVQADGVTSKPNVRTSSIFLNHLPGYSSFYFGQFKLRAMADENLNLIGELQDGRFIQLVANK